MQSRVFWQLVRVVGQVEYGADTLALQRVELLVGQRQVAEVDALVRQQALGEYVREREIATEVAVDTINSSINDPTLAIVKLILLATIVSEEVGVFLWVANLHLPSWDALPG